MGGRERQHPPPASREGKAARRGGHRRVQRPRQGTEAETPGNQKSQARQMEKAGEPGPEAGSGGRRQRRAKSKGGQQEF